MASGKYAVNDVTSKVNSTVEKEVAIFGDPTIMCNIVHLNEGVYTRIPFMSTGIRVSFGKRVPGLCKTRELTQPDTGSAN